MNRRRFLKYAAAATAGVAGASTFGLKYLLNEPNPTRSVTTSLGSSLSTSSTRMLASDSDFQHVLQLTQSNSQAASYLNKIREDAFSILNQTPYQYNLCKPSECRDDVPTILSISEGVLRRIYTLGLLYRLEGDRRFLDRAWSELKSVANFPDWNSRNHFLDTAEMTHASAIGYDWFPWSEDQKRILRDAIIQKGLTPATDCYEGKADFGWWVNVNHNWNLVCNSGIGMGALSLLPELPDLCNKIISQSLQSMMLPLRQFAPDGGWVEGPHYWRYATSYCCVYLAALQHLELSDNGLSKLPGFSETGTFRIHTTGPFRRTFNFADASINDDDTDTCQLFWFASVFQRPLYSWYSQISHYKDWLPLALLWFQPTFQNPTSVQLATGAYFRNVEVATLRSSWDDPNAMFIGFKAGSNGQNHGHLDVGSFVLDALGQRWAIDLGRDDYSLPGYFDKSKRRWIYYRTRAEGHNTLVLNPTESPDQNILASTKITKYSANPNFSFAIADLTAAYGSTNSIVQAIRRGVGVTKDHVIIQDEIIPSGSLDLWWFMHTDSTIQKGDDDRTLTLFRTRNYTSLQCSIVSPQEAKFSIMDAKPLASSPNPAGQDANKGIRKLTVHQNLTTPTTLSIVMYPLQRGQQPPNESPSITPLDQW